MRVDYLAGIDAAEGPAAPAATSLRWLYGISRAAPLIGRDVAGYRIDGILGRGTTSIACKATRVVDGELVAVKVLSPVSSDLVDGAIVDRFRFEAHALAEVRHPNVVSVLDFGTTDDGLLYTVMELLEGETLARLLGSQGRLEPGAAVRIACAIAEGLHALHERGLLHRDVKPSNVFVGCDPHGVEVVKVMDLGLARALSSPTEGTGTSGAPASDIRPRRRMNTREGLVLGTGAYMSPELIQGGELDARSDVYALGVVTYRMLTGTLPFSGDDLPHLLSLHLSDPVEPMAQRAPSAGLSRALDAVVLRALEKDPEWRQRTARDFASELRVALGEGDVEQAAIDAADAEPVEAAPADVVPSSRRRVTRSTVGVVFVLAAMLALYGVARRGRMHASDYTAPTQTTTMTPSITPLPNAAPATPTPWDVVVGDAVIDHRHRGASISHREPKRAPESTPIENTATPDDFKVPMWKSKATEMR